MSSSATTTTTPSSSSSRDVITCVITDVSSGVISIMSTSFLVESLLASNDDSSRQSQQVSDITDSQLLTRPHHRLNYSTTRNNNLNAATTCHVLAGGSRRFDDDRQYLKLMSEYHSSCKSLLNHRVSFQPPQVAAVVDAYIQLQTLTAAMRCNAETTGGGCSSDTHQRRRHVNNVPQSLKLTATSLAPRCRQLATYNDKQLQRQSRAYLHHSCVTSSSQHHVITAHTSHVTTAAQTGQ